MKRTFTLFLVLSFTLKIYSQTEIQVSTDVGYVDEVYYSFEDSVLKTSPRSAWDIAFSTSQMSVSVLANTGAEIMVYTYPNGTLDDWATVDTTGIEWTPQYNSIETWENGAYNANTIPGDQLDYGWGRYNISNHVISGDSLFIVVINDTIYKKLAVVNKEAIGNNYTFKYADLDGSNEVSETFDADDYSTSFVHYSIQNGEYVTQEPDTRWQLLFTRYFDYNIPFYVSGILANSGVKIQEVSGVEQSTYVDYDSLLFTDTISIIGSDWKSFNMETFQYDIADDVVYFVQDTLDGEETHPIWKIYFTAFGGSADGNYTFIQEKLGGQSTNINISKQANLTIYPNPANNQVNIIHDLNGWVEILVYSMDGKLVLQSKENNTSGLYNQQLDINALSPGIYNMTIRSKNNTLTKRFIKE